MTGCGEDPNLGSNSKTSLSGEINEGEVVKNLDGDLQFLDLEEEEIPTKKIKQDPLYNNFKAYVTANPSLRRAEFYQDGTDLSDDLAQRLYSRGLDIGLNRGGSLYITYARGLDYFSTTLDALRKFLHEISIVEVTYEATNEVTEIEKTFVKTYKADGKFFGIGLSSASSFESFSESLEAKTDIFNTVVNIGEAGFSFTQSYTHNMDTIESNFIDQGLSAFDFLKYLHHHECISFEVMRYSDGYEVIFCMILKKDGNGGPRYTNSNVRKASLNIKGGNLESGVVFKPNGEQCPISKVENGNGMLVHYNDDGQEIRRRKYFNGQPLLD